ncbi:MAG: thiamine-phosphate synthase family protein [Pyrodictiaceae archaeon]
MLLHEVAARRIIPALRGLLAHMLARKGFSQSRIAMLLDITQPMVNKYLRRGMEEYLAILVEEGLEKNKAIDLIEPITHLLPQLGRHERSILLASLTNILLANTNTCRELATATGKNICSMLFGVAEDPNLAMVRKALAELRSIKCIDELIPNVGSNLVYAPFADNKESLVIGLDGRIIRKSGGIFIAGEPRYGGSKHTARILVAVRRKYPSRRAAIVLAYTGNIVHILKEMGLSMLETGPHSSQDNVIADIAKSIEESELGNLDAIVDAGGEGIEPVIYLLAKNLEELLSRLKTICNKLARNHAS